jgi:diguanylate cyclase (GGDEF)-like protein
MHSREKDYRYLLLELLPHHRLSRGRRRDIARVLDRGEPADMRRVAVTALEDLCEIGYFSRGEARRDNGNTTLTYSRSQGNFQLRLRVPTPELDGFQTAPGTPGPEHAVDVSFDILPEIIRSFSISERRESIFDRLDSTMQLLPSWFGVSAARLVLALERIGDESESDLIITLPEKEIVKQAAFEHARRSGEVEFLHPAAALALGMDRPRRMNREVGEPRLVAVAPLFTSSAFWGVLELWLPGTDDGAAQRSRLEVASAMIEQIIDNTERLANLTSVDKLTGIYNRNFYDVQVNIEIERAKRSGGKLSMLVLDIDDFKSVNDRYGHHTGDQALILVADAIKGNLRKIDLPFRYGGEEFVALLPGTGEVEAIHTAERLRSMIAELDGLVDEDGRTIPLRVSIGGAVYPDNASGAAALFKRADEALYEAKSTGKNRVAFYKPS